jgi:hypothetical protein
MTKKTKAVIAAACGTAIVVAAIAAGYTPEEVGTLIRAVVACLVGVI